MITASPGARIMPAPPRALVDWRQLWREAVIDAHELLALVGLTLFCVAVTSLVGGSWSSRSVQRFR